MTTTDISTQPKSSTDMSMGNMLRQVSSLTPTLTHDGMNLAPRYNRHEKSNDSPIHTYQFDQDRRNSKTIF